MDGVEGLEVWIKEGAIPLVDPDAAEKDYQGGVMPLQAGCGVNVSRAIEADPWIKRSAKTRKY